MPSLWWFDLEGVADAKRLELFRMSDADLTAYCQRRMAEDVVALPHQSWPEMEPVIAASAERQAHRQPADAGAAVGL